MTDSGRPNSSPRGGPAQPRPLPAPSALSGEARPRFTGRAAILAVFFCAIVLSLAYPVREYIAERRQIDQLEAQQAQIARQLSRLAAERRRLNDPAYIEQLARDRLHMCLPDQMCYVVINPVARSKASASSTRAADPWYAKLWSSVQFADGKPAHRAGGARNEHSAHSATRHP